MEGGVLSTADLAVRHDDLRVQSQPLSRTLLWGGGVTGGGRANSLDKTLMLGKMEGKKEVGGRG